MALAVLCVTFYFFSSVVAEKIYQIRSQR